jgi:hypothetical protein
MGDRTTRGGAIYYSSLFRDFSESDNSLRVYSGERLLFFSNKDRLLPLMEYIERFPLNNTNVVIFDRITGNAAALLAVRAGATEVHSLVGSQRAINTLEEYGLKYYFDRTVPYIQKDCGEGMCPMETLSLGKKPEEFYRIIKMGAGK